MAEYMDISRIDDWDNLSIIDDDGNVKYVYDVGELPRADVIEIPEDVTIGDMIRMLFLCVEVDEKSEDTVHLKDKWHNPLVFIQIPKDIWNAPYKKGE